MKINSVKAFIKFHVLNVTIQYVHNQQYNLKTSTCLSIFGACFKFTSIANLVLCIYLFIWLSLHSPDSTLQTVKNELNVYHKCTIFSHELKISSIRMFCLFFYCFFFSEIFSIEHDVYFLHKLHKFAFQFSNDKCRKIHIEFKNKMIV